MTLQIEATRGDFCHVSLDGDVATAPAYPGLILSADQARDRIAFAGEAHSTNSIQSSLGICDAAKRKLPSYTAIPTDMLTEIDRLAGAAKSPRPIAKIVNENATYPYLISAYRVRLHLQQKAWGRRDVLPRTEPIPASMIDEIDHLSQSGKGAKAIAVVINKNSAHPCVINATRIASYLERRCYGERRLVPRTVGIPAKMKQEIERLHEAGEGFKTIAEIMNSDSSYKYSIAYSRVQSHLLSIGRRPLLSSEPIPDSMMQAIDQLHETGKAARAIATIMNANSEYPNTIGYPRIESYLWRQNCAGKEVLSRNEPVPESMLEDIYRMHAAGSGAKVIARTINDDRNHERAIFYTRIVSMFRPKLNGKNAIRKKRNGRLGNLRNPKQINQRSVVVTRSANRPNVKELDDIDLDGVLDAIVGDESATFKVGIFDTLYASKKNFTA